MRKSITVVLIGLLIGLALIVVPVPAAPGGAVFEQALSSGIIPDAGFAARGVCGKIVDAPMPGTSYIMKSGKVYHAYLDYRNTGTKTWNSTNMMLKYKDPDAKLFTPKPVRVQGTVVPHGATYRFSFRMTAPERKGSCLAWYGLSKANGASFGDNGYFPVTVV